MSVDCAFYSRGVRDPAKGMSLEEAAASPRRGNNFVWIELHEPEPELMAEVSGHFGLHELAVEDAAHAHQRPKVEAYDDFYFIVYKSARYDHPTNEVVFGELDVFLGPGFVIAVRHGEPADPERARRHLEQFPELLKSGPAAAVWAILDMVVDDYSPVTRRPGRGHRRSRAGDLRRRGEPDRADLHAEDARSTRSTAPSTRCSPPSTRSSAAPSSPSIRASCATSVTSADHVRRIQEEIVAHRDQLSSVLEAHLSLINLRQSEIATEQNRSSGG